MKFFMIAQMWILRSHLTTSGFKIHWSFGSLKLKYHAVMLKIYQGCLVHQHVSGTLQLNVYIIYAKMQCTSDNQAWVGFAWSIRMKSVEIHISLFIFSIIMDIRKNKHCSLAGLLHSSNKMCCRVCSQH